MKIYLALFFEEVCCVGDDAVKRLYGPHADGSRRVMVFWKNFLASDSSV